MTSRELVQAIFEHRGTQNVFWTGSPREDTMRKYCSEQGFSGQEELYTFLNDDVRHVHAEYGYRRWGERPFFLTHPAGRESLSQAGRFAEATSVEEVKDGDYPSAEDMDFSGLVRQFRAGHVEEEGDFGGKDIRGKAVFSGMWCEFFHIVSDFFGMENYFCKMYTDPEVVHYVTDRVEEFFLGANEAFFRECGDFVDVMFMGNDFGTQRGLLISPEMFDEFVLPTYRKLIAIGKRYGKKVMVHSCGSVFQIIPRLIDAGVDALHPLQALAAGMEPERLAAEYGKDLVFVGAVDSQDLLMNGTPEQVRDRVHQLRDIFGPNYIVSSSHEALLPNVPFENVVAMARAAKE